MVAQSFNNLLYVVVSMTKKNLSKLLGRDCGSTHRVMVEVNRTVKESSIET